MRSLVIEIFTAEKTVIFNKNVIYDEFLLDSIEKLNNILKR